MEKESPMKSASATESIGSTLKLDPVPSADGPMDEKLSVLVTMEPGGGSRPHRHEIKFSLDAEQERFLHVSGSMVVRIRKPGETTWWTEYLDDRNRVVEIPPGAEHCVYTYSVARGAVFRAETIRAHLVDNEHGGDVHRTPFEQLPEDIKWRIKDGLIL